LNGLEVVDAIKAVLDEIEKRGIGQRKVNYKQRDAGYSRQRYWGEPFPIKYGPKHVEGFEDLGGAEDIPVPLSEDQLPLVLPEVSSFKPGGDGRSPLANSEAWVKAGYETDTMPGYAGSSWYFLRYMDAKNPNEFAAKDKIDYWKNVDIYFGGAEHAVGHLLYSRMWHKFLHDLGYVPTDEPFQKMVNQGMIQGVSKFVYRMTNFYVDTPESEVKTKGIGFPYVFVSKEFYDKSMSGTLSQDDKQKLEAVATKGKEVADKYGFASNLKYRIEEFTKTFYLLVMIRAM